MRCLRTYCYDEQRNEQVSPEVRERAVRMVLDHEADHPSHWATCKSIPAEIDVGKRAGLSTDMVAKMKATYMAWAEFLCPARDRFIGDDNVAPQQHSFNQAQRKLEVELHCVYDDLGREAMALIADE